MEDALSWHLDPDTSALHLSGEPDATEAEQLARAVADLVLPPGPLLVELDELDVEDGVAVAHLVNAVRAIAASRVVTLRHCPQMLAHTLYKVGDLQRIRLEAPRHDEAWGA